MLCVAWRRRFHATVADDGHSLKHSALEHPSVAVGVRSGVIDRVLGRDSKVDTLAVCSG